MNRTVASLMTASLLATSIVVYNTLSVVAANVTVDTSVATPSNATMSNSERVEDFDEIATPSQADRYEFDLSVDKDESIIGKLNLRTGKLTIRGDGEIADFMYSPFEEVAEFILEVEIKGDITAIGSCTFSGLSNIERVRLSNSIERIGFEAFSGCEALEEVRLPKNLQMIEDSAFLGCSNLKYVHTSGKSASKVREVATASNASYFVDGSVLPECSVGYGIFEGTSISMLDVSNISDYDSEFLHGMTSLETLVYSGDPEFYSNLDLDGLKDIVWDGGIDKSNMQDNYINESATVYCLPDSEVMKWCIENGKSYRIIGEQENSGTYNVEVPESINFNTWENVYYSENIVTITNKSDTANVAISKIENMHLAESWEQVDVSDEQYWIELPVNTYQYAIEVDNNNLYIPYEANIQLQPGETKDLLCRLWTGTFENKVYEDTLSSIVITLDKG